MKNLLFIILIFTVITAFGQHNFRMVTGKVKDGDGPLSGVMVRIKGSKTTVVTDSLGKYNISVPQGSVLIFRMIGYKDQEVTVGTHKKINIRLLSPGREVE